jgi:hypothetical protein
MEEKWKVYSLLVGKPEGNGPLVKPKHWWADNIKMDRVEWGELDWAARDRDKWRDLVEKVMNLRFP